MLSMDTFWAAKLIYYIQASANSQTAGGSFTGASNFTMDRPHFYDASGGIQNIYNYPQG